LKEILFFLAYSEGLDLLLARMLESANSSTHVGAAANTDDAIDWTPLLMSLIAGMSTCLGAIWVFFKKPVVERGGPRQRAQVIKPSTMSCSLALAGSVMVTVSVVSIIPECLRENSATETYKMIPIFSVIFLQRLFFHILGYVLYFLLAKFAFPEPDEILGFHQTKSPEDEQAGLMLLKSEDSTVSELDSMESAGHNSSLEESTTPTKEPTDKARHRRMNDRQKSNVARSTSGESNIRSMNRLAKGFGVSVSTNSDSDLNGDTTLEDTDDHNRTDNYSKEKPDISTKNAICCQRLTHYSSGADLESNESKRAWRVAMLLFLSLAVQYVIALWCTRILLRARNTWYFSPYQPFNSSLAVTFRKA
jgi:ZIP family zinc transporter